MISQKVIEDLETHIEQVVSHFWFEVNNQQTREDLRISMFPYLSNLIEEGYEIEQVCDESNNSHEVIDNNELYYVVYIKKDDDLRQINTVMRKTGVSFQELRPA